MTKLVGLVALGILLCLMAPGCSLMCPPLNAPTIEATPLDPLGECDEWLIRQREGARPRGCVLDERD